VLQVAQLFPVMVYIHGGEFQKGSANEFPGHQLAANGQVSSGRNPLTNFQAVS
jgi:carboxylesterase type B